MSLVLIDTNEMITRDKFERDKYDIALTYSTVLASTLPNSTIVVYTDGTAGEIESGIMVRTNRFFKKIVDHAINHRTRIYTLQ